LALGLNLDFRSSSLRFWYSRNDTGVDNRLFETGVNEVLDVDVPCDVLFTVLQPLVLTLTGGFSTFSIH
jgi:hypothetical protein